MVIRELHLYGFGKFNDYTLKLQSGLNLVHGPNESGKSTLHSFINGMFYGFKKPYTRRTLYSNDHNRLSPWSGTHYSGSIVFEKEGQLYRIFRVFEKGREETKVYQEETGEDITDRISKGDNSRILQPGEYFFGLNSGIFNNTLFIEQKNITPLGSLAHEVRERLVNASTGGDEKISVEKALSFLDEQLKEIGTIRASTSQYGRLVAEIDKAEKSLMVVEADVAKYKEKAKRRRQILDQVKNLEIDIEKSQTIIGEMERQKKIGKYQEILALRKKNNGLGEELETLLVHDTKDQDDYNEAMKISEEIGLVKSRIGSMEEQLAEIEGRTRRLYGSKNHGKEEFKEILEDGQRFQKLDYRTTGEDDLESLVRELEKQKKRRMSLRLIQMVFVIAYLTSTIYSFSQVNYLLLGIAQTLLMPILYLMVRARTNNGQIDKLETGVNLELEKDSILTKYKLSNGFEFYEMLEKAKVDKMKAEQEAELMAELNESREGLTARVSSLGTELLALEKGLEGLLSKNHAHDMNSFRQGLEKKLRLREIKREIEYNQETIMRILEGESIEELARLHNDYSNGKKDMNSSPLNEVAEKHQMLIQRKSDLLLAVNQLDGSLSQLESSLETEMILQEKIQALIVKKSYLTKRKESLELARARIKALSGEIHREFAPSLNKRVGDFIGRITSGRYSDVKIDRNLGFNLVQSDGNRLIPLENLSGGTLDQMYFGLRMGIVDELISSNLPIFLDECFSQYDDTRLENILNYIASFENRQIIIFTCQMREEEALERLGKSYNKINLQFS